MNCRGLVDPENRPFGYVLPLEIQVRIMFWVHCFHTIDERKKVIQELKELPKCSIMGFPKRLGEFQYWNQVVFRLHARRTTPCHHCHRRLDHRLSVSPKRFLLVDGVEQMIHFFLGFFQIGMMTEMARDPTNLDNLMNEGIAFVIDQFKDRIPHCPVGQRPVMIGRRKRSYDTVDKVMKRLDLVMKVMSAMNFVIIDIH